MKSHTNHGASVRRLRWSTLYFDGKTGEMTSTLCTSASGFASQDARQLSRADRADAIKLVRLHPLIETRM